MTETEVAQALGKQVCDGKPLSCPVCSDDDVVQPMASVGDMRQVLFCPHCDLTVELEVTFR